MKMFEGAMCVILFKIITSPSFMSNCVSFRISSFVDGTCVALK